MRIRSALLILFVALPTFLLLALVGYAYLAPLVGDGMASPAREIRIPVTLDAQ